MAVGEDDRVDAPDVVVSACCRKIGPGIDEQRGPIVASAMKIDGRSRRSRGSVDGRWRSRSRSSARRATCRCRGR